jgi:prepilin-type N-terminal cleavage/methylation domain-containing protein
MKNTQLKNGFGIIELLVALAITAILLVAVAVAFNASVMNYSENEDIFKAVNSARQAAYRITTQLRTANAVEPNEPTNRCSFITAGGEDLTYRFDPGENRLYLITNDDLSDIDYVLCENVTAMSFTKETGIDPDDASIYVKSVYLSLTVEVGDVRRTVSAAAVIRRNMKDPSPV